MCGIAGAIALKPGTSIDRVSVEALTNRMTHRGPDSGGFVHQAAFSFGCRRLAITDPSPRSDQPFCDATRTVITVFNGEIYNHSSLRQELISHGSEFRTDSDTEVLVEAYKHWGAECLSRFNGMFAFALFDARSQSFLIARDRIGVKPLYYAVFDDLLVFGSEIKVIERYPGFRRDLAPDAIVRFLRFRYVPFGDQYYRGLRKLAPGGALTMREGRLQVHAYWDVQLGETASDSESSAISGLIANSVALQMKSDAPTALFLSGGTDSSILALHARDQVSGVVAITAQVPGAAYDESPAAARVAAAMGLKHRVVPISIIRSLDPVRRLIRIKDQPLGMHNELAMAELASEAVKHSKVALCGEGADELFAGYARTFRFPFTFARSHSLKALRGGALADDAFWRYVLDRYFYIPDAELVKLLRPEFQNSLKDEELAHWTQSLFARGRQISRFQQISYFFLKLHLPGLLEMVDAATMSVGLEARVPYTDHRLVEMAFALAANRKLKWRSPFHAAAAALLPLRLWSGKCDVPKAILGEAYRRRLPRAVFDQSKKGFPMPLGRWLSHNEEVKSLLLERGARLHEFFLPAALRSLHSRNSGGSDDTLGRRVWILANLALFLET